MLTSYVARIGWTLAREGLRDRVGALDEVRLPMRVWPTDIDPYAHLNNGRYLTLMDVGRYQMAVRTGLSRVMLHRGWWPVLGGAAVQFRRELRLFARFDLVTRLRAWDDKWFFIEQRFERDREIYASALVRAVFRHRKHSIPPGDVMAAVGYDGPTPPIPQVDWTKRSFRATDPAPCQGSNVSSGR